MAAARQSNLPYLPEGREIFYVSKNHPWMLAAKRVCDLHSTDFNHPTGCVIVKNETIIGFGANRSSIKNKTALRWHAAGLCLRRLGRIPSGKCYWLCPGCASPLGHAENQAVKNMLAAGSSGEGADLYLYGHWWCCKSCWDSMISAGIRNVYLLEGAAERFGS